MEKIELKLMSTRIDWYQGGHTSLKLKFNAVQVTLICSSMLADLLGKGHFVLNLPRCSNLLREG